MLSIEILNKWNVSNEKIQQIYKSAWQIGDKYILKTGNNLNELKKNLLIIQALSDQDIPVAIVVKTVNGLDYITIDNEYFFLSRMING